MLFHSAKALTRLMINVEELNYGIKYDLFILRFIKNVQNLTTCNKDLYGDNSDAMVYIHINKTTKVSLTLI
jgi:hypothetical protein